MFILIMQFTWKYIDDLMGKGLGAGVITELMFYVSASLIPLALPLAILLSSIMTLGNLAENNELTALKSSGLSLLKIMRPLIGVVILIATATFFFSNYVIPVANLKWHSLIYDIQQTKVSLLVTPGSYSKEIESYAIKVENGQDNSFTGITIHDYTDPKVSKTIKADSGTIYKSENGNYLLFQLMNGKVIEELNAQPPIFGPRGTSIDKRSGSRPANNIEFKEATYKMDLLGFDLNRSQEEMFKDDYEMLNVFQIQDARDSMQRESDEHQTAYIQSRKSERPYFQSKQFALLQAKQKNQKADTTLHVPEGIISLKDFSKEERKAALNMALVNIRDQNQNLENQKMIFNSLEDSNNKFILEFHRKFALSATIIVLFFVGAPLGAIVRKGGFGAPVVIAALLFMVYFVLFSIGESLANTNSVTPFWGMWMPTVVLAPIAVVLMTAAANDLRVFDRKTWRILLSFGFKR
jgi:lipopolysaccharide export system permease protein